MTPLFDDMSDKEEAMWNDLHEAADADRDEMLTICIRRVIRLEETLRHSCDDIAQLVVALQFACSENLLTVQATANVASYKVVLEAAA